MTEPMLSVDEARVLGAMIEKAMTTPDHYPMSLNAVTTACNQVSNREPVTDFAEGFVERTLRELADRGLAKMVHRAGDRVVKYRHALDAALETGPEETALVAVLLLRGPQTPGELRQRTQRYVEFSSLPDVESTLEALRHREPPLVRREDRRPGQKEHRYREVISAAGHDPVPGDAAPASVETAPAAAAPSELDALHAAVDELRRRVDRIMSELGLEE